MQSLTLKFLTLLLVAVVTVGVGLFACTPEPEPGTTTEDEEQAPPTILRIYVELSPNATNLFEPIANTNNDIYIIGGLSKFKAGGVGLGNWDSDWGKVKNAKLTKYTNNIYTITLESTELTADLNLEFKFINGTPGYGPSNWTTVENAPGTGDYGNRKILVEAGKEQEVWLTNQTLTNEVTSNQAWILGWNAVAYTAPVTGTATVYVLVTNVLLGYTNLASFDEITNITNWGVSGGGAYPLSWGGVSLLVSNVTIVETNTDGYIYGEVFFGPVYLTNGYTFEFKLRHFYNSNWQWHTGNNMIGSVSLSDLSNNSTVTNTNNFTIESPAGWIKLPIAYVTLIYTNVALAQEGTDPVDKLHQTNYGLSGSFNSWNDPTLLADAVINITTNSGIVYGEVHFSNIQWPLSLIEFKLRRFNVDNIWGWEENPNHQLDLTVFQAESSTNVIENFTAPGWQWWQQ